MNLKIIQVKKEFKMNREKNCLVDPSHHVISSLLQALKPVCSIGYAAYPYLIYTPYILNGFEYSGRICDFSYFIMNCYTQYYHFLTKACCLTSLTEVRSPNTK